VESAKRGDPLGDSQKANEGLGQMLVGGNDNDVKRPTETDLTVGLGRSY